jgi:Na+/proline symporter
MTPVMASRILFPDLAAIWPGDPHPEEAAFVTLALTLLPNGLIGLTLSAILAAAMTSIDTQLNFLASILIRDVYVRLRTGSAGKPPSQKEQLTASRLTAIVLGILATITAIFFQRWKSVFEVALNYYSWFGPSMLTPVMLGFLFRRTPSWSAMASATSGLIVVFVLNVFTSFGDIQYEVNILAGVGTSTLVFFLSAFWPERLPAAVERIRLFFVDQDTPAEVEGLRWSGNALASYQIVGVLTMGIGGVVVFLGLVPASMPVHLITVVLGAGTVFLGWLMIWYFRRQTKLMSKG